MNAEAFAALNEFEAAVSAYKREQAEAIAALAALNELEAEFTCELEQSK